VLAWIDERRWARWVEVVDVVVVEATAPDVAAVVARDGWVVLPPPVPTATAYVLVVAIASRT
jgi:hypothetical protein